ncbi:MAG: small multi-drug export protein [Oscillospiraceae bacterium]|jgi:uncharacterized membrane protein|nr:small multi-drug export protein [Oscillospiraceae bacterium]
MNLVEFLTDTLTGRGIVTFLSSMVPIIELRGAIPYGVMSGLPIWISAVVAIFGNILPVPFIILFARRILDWMKTKSLRLCRLAGRLENRARSKRLYKGELLGLFLFVAIPLPGTGAWTGALIAAVLSLRLKYAFPVIAAGVAAAGVIIALLTSGVGAVVS